ILIDTKPSVYLIDFDSASRLHQKIASPKKTLNRFRRSLERTYDKNEKDFSVSDWDTIVSHYFIS
ncbi:MAG: hypothetical protein CMD98_01045, partial [Gammaproteobacteria bacterium]|nr:hypothetical protein [Gammaproteobacteria bacterium]